MPGLVWVLLEGHLSPNPNMCLKQIALRKGSNGQLSKFFSKRLAPLDQLGWLSKCSPTLQSWFARNGRWIEVAAGKSLFWEADKTDGMYGVGSGAVDVEFAPEGLEKLAITRVAPGNWLGHGCLQPDMPRPFNLIAATDCKVYFVARQALRQLVSDQPKYWPEFHALSLRQVLGLMTVLCESHTLTSEARLARLLLRLSITTPEIEIRQTDLIALLGMSHSNVRRALKSLADAKIIKTGYNRIFILNNKRLELISRQSR